MVAEALPEVGQEPPNDDALLTPETPTEAAPPADNQEEDTSHIDAFLEGLGAEDAGTEGVDGKGVPTDGVVPPAEKVLTPEEAREEGKREKEAELAQQDAARERQRYLDGMAFVVKDVPAKLKALAERNNMTAGDYDELVSEFNRLNGAYKPLFDHAVAQQAPQVKMQAYQEAEAAISGHLLTAIAEDLGDAAHKAITGEIGKSIKSWPDMAKAIAKEARKGYVAKEEVTKGQRKLAERIDTALKGRGLSLKDITGNGGSDLPPIRGGNGVAVHNDYDNDLAFNEGRITREQWKANNDRFRKQERT